MPFTVKEFPNRRFDTVEEYKTFVERRNELLASMEARKKGAKLLKAFIIKKGRIMEALRNASKGEQHEPEDSQKHRSVQPQGRE